MGSHILVNCICHAPTILCVTILLYCGTKYTCFGVVSFIVFAWHACKEQGGGGGGQNNKMYYLLLWRTSAYF